MEAQKRSRSLCNSAMQDFNERAAAQPDATPESLQVMSACAIVREMAEHKTQALAEELARLSVEKKRELLRPILSSLSAEAKCDVADAMFRYTPAQTRGGSLMQGLFTVPAAELTFKDVILFSVDEERDPDANPTNIARVAVGQLPEPVRSTLVFGYKACACRIPVREPFERRHSTRSTLAPFEVALGSEDVAFDNLEKLIKLAAPVAPASWLVDGVEDECDVLDFISEWLAAECWDAAAVQRGQALAVDGTEDVYQRAPKLHVRVTNA
jgi:hypothetical protein